jgi:8-oxo-dGTP pyrophosphatase MutT (NUDIX family)
VPRTGHIATIRAHVGTDLLLIPAVTNVVLDDDHRVLLLHHTDWDGWGTPGGAMEPGETPAAAAARELEEETGLQVRPFALVGVVGGEDAVITYPNGDRTAYVTTILASRWDGSPVRPDGIEVDEGRFVGATQWRTLPMQASMRDILALVFAWIGDLETSGSAPARFQPLD